MRTSYRLRIFPMKKEGSVYETIRLMATVELRSAGAQIWAPFQYPAVVDTGSPVSLLPCDIWDQLNPPSAGTPDTLTFAGMSIEQLGWLDLRLLVDGGPPSRVIKVRAGRVPVNCPVILGFADFLTEGALFCDYPPREAHITL